MGTRRCDNFSEHLINRFWPLIRPNFARHVDETFGLGWVVWFGGWGGFIGHWFNFPSRFQVEAFL